MKIVVLSGGLCTERHVGLVSGSGVCRALREKGHQAIFVDMFMGLEDYTGDLHSFCKNSINPTIQPPVERIISFWLGKKYLFNR